MTKPEKKTLTMPKPPKATKPKSHKKWDYLSTSLGLDYYSSDAEITEKLHKLGDEGWELVSVDKRMTDRQYVFKREKK